MTCRGKGPAWAAGRARRQEAWGLGLCLCGVEEGWVGLGWVEKRRRHQAEEPRSPKPHPQLAMQELLPLSL